MIIQNSENQILPSSSSPVISSSPIEPRLQPKSINFRSIQYGLRIILRGQQEQHLKKLIESVLFKFSQTGDPKVCRSLNPSSYELLTKVRSFIKFFRLSFIELTNHSRQYFKYQDTNIIQKIVQFQQKLDINDLKGSYHSQLQILKTEYNWSDKFVQEWEDKAIQLQGKQKLPFQNGYKPQINNGNSLKRSQPTKCDKCETETQSSQAPKKKIKKDSLNYKSVVKALETMIRHSRDQKRQQLQNRLEKYQQTQDGQYLKIQDADICRKLFDLRSYMKIFADSFLELTNKDQYRVFADKSMLFKIFDIQQYINPGDILTSYKIVIRKQQQKYGWTNQMVSEWIDKVIQLKKKQIETMSRRK